MNSKELSMLYEQVKGNIELSVEVEGVEIPKVWQEKILEPIAFAVYQQELFEKEAA